MIKPGKSKTLCAALCTLSFLGAAVTDVPVAQAGSEVPTINQHPPMTPILAERLKHLTMDDAIDIAVHRNPDILRQLQEIQRTQGVVVEVRSGYLPHLIGTGTFQQTDRRLLSGGGSTTGVGSTTGGSINTGGTTTGANGSGTDLSGFNFKGTVPNPDGSNTRVPVQIPASDLFSQLFGANGTNINQRSYNLTIEVQQTIYNAALPPQYRQARFTRDNAYYQLRETVDTVINTLKTQFYTVLLDEALIKIQEENLNLLENQLRDQQNRFAAGTVPRFDVLQASVAVSNQRPQLITARNDFNLGFIGLARTLGVEYGPDQQKIAPIKVIGNLDYHPQDFSAEAGVASAKAYRALLKQQRQNILIQIDQIRYEAAGYQPTLTGTAGYELENNRYNQDLTDTVNGYFFGANFNWNIFDGLATYGRVKQARASLASAKLTYDDAIRQVVQEVQTNYLNLQQNKQLVASQVANVGQAEEAVRLAQARLSAGAGTQLDVLQSQTALSQAQTTELQARYNYAVTLANYERVTATSTVYPETFDDPLTRKDRVTGKLATPTGADAGERKLPPSTIRTPSEGVRGTGRPAKNKINAEHPGVDVNPTLQTGDRDQVNRTAKGDLYEGYPNNPKNDARSSQKPGKTLPPSNDKPLKGFNAPPE